MPQVTIEQAIAIAIEHHRAGRLAQAEMLYRQVLAQQANHPDALHLLGVIAHQVGRHESAVDLIRESIRIRPNYADSYINLGNALTALGKANEAIEAARQAIGLKPDLVEAHGILIRALKDLGEFNEAAAALRQVIRYKPDDAELHADLGNTLYRLRKLDEAVSAYRRAIDLAPDYAEASNNLSVVLCNQGKFEDAIASCRRALQLRPEYPEAFYNLGNSLTALGKLDDAIAAYRQVIHLKPDYAEAYANLGSTLINTGRPEEAEEFCRHAVRLAPGRAEVWSNLGAALHGQFKIDEAIVACRQAIALDPHCAEAHGKLGLGLLGQGKRDEAVVAFRRAIQVNPKYSEAYSNLGIAHFAQGRLDEAINCYKQAVALQPDNASCHSNLIYTLHFHPGYDADAIHTAHRDWNRRHAAPFEKFITPHPNDRDPDRRLKIGYVSPDFCSHPVARFMLPVMDHHDHRNFEVHGYANVRRPDALTEHFRGRADLWRNIVGCSDDRVAEFIRQDGIDILVDLTMHMADSRLLVFARKPAPVQVTWLAYAGTTGMDAMDYRLTDSFLDPDTEDAFYAERSVRLPDCWWCYRPSAEAPEVGEQPALNAGKVTFGCLNNFCKVTPEALTCWSKLLQQVPDSRLVLHSPEGSHRQGAKDHLSRENVDPARLVFFGRLPESEYLRLYHQIDIGLDPFPYSGGTTSCDAMWMGVPVVTLSGPTAVGRGTTTLLHNIGLPELVADSQEEYIRIASELAADVTRLSRIRLGLRKRMRESPLMDELRFTGNLEVAYRKMWRTWCEGHGQVLKDD